MGHGLVDTKIIPLSRARGWAWPIDDITHCIDAWASRLMCTLDSRFFVETGNLPFISFLDNALPKAQVLVGDEHLAMCHGIKSRM